MSFEYPPKWCTYSAVLFVTWLVPRETAAVSARSVYTIRPCTMSRHFMQSHKHRVQCVFVCLHCWQNVWDPFRATPVTRGCSDELRINLAAQFWTCQMESFHRVQWEPGEAELENISRRNIDHDETREAQGSESKIVSRSFFFLFLFSCTQSQNTKDRSHTLMRARARAHTHTQIHVRTHACTHTHTVSYTHLTLPTIDDV